MGAAGQQAQQPARGHRQQDAGGRRQRAGQGGQPAHGDEHKQHRHRPEVHQRGDQRQAAESVEPEGFHRQFHRHGHRQGLHQPARPAPEPVLEQRVEGQDAQGGRERELEPELQDLVWVGHQQHQRGQGQGRGRVGAAVEDQRRLDDEGHDRGPHGSGRGPHQQAVGHQYRHRRQGGPPPAPPQPRQQPAHRRQHGAYLGAVYRQDVCQAGAAEVVTQHLGQVVALAEQQAAQQGGILRRQHGGNALRQPVPGPGCQQPHRALCAQQHRRAGDAEPEVDAPAG